MIDLLATRFCQFINLMRYILKMCRFTRIADYHFGHCCKVSDEAAFVLFKGLTFQKLCLRARISPDHHNKMLLARRLRSARITSIPLMVA